MLRLAVNVLAGIALTALLLAGGALLWLKQTDSRALSVQSGSMAPAINKGDLVIVKASPKYRAGDVITFVSPGDEHVTITHRVISVGENGRSFQTKGDANASADRPIAARMVVGRVEQAVPYAGYALDFVRKPMGLLLVIYIPALMIIAQELQRLARHYKKMQPYRVPGRAARRYKMRKTGRQRLAAAVKMSTLCIVAGLAVMVPARAALHSEVILAGNTISAIAALDHIVFRRVEFKCSPDNTGQVNKLPEIFMHNPTGEGVSTGGWYIESNEGRIVTFPPQTVFDMRDDYDIEPDLQAGVHYEGDYLALYDNAGILVDAISWGTDTTHLNPALPGTQDGTSFRRLDLTSDTNTATDWAVSVRLCGE